MSSASEEKLQTCLSFITRWRERITVAEPKASRPLFVGLNGCQGCGKTTLVEALAQELQLKHGLPTAVISIDDFYLPYKEQCSLAADHPDNPLIRHRGQPSTHDLGLASSVLQALKQGKRVAIPSYDKGAFNGMGDRKPEASWSVVNEPGRPPVQVVIIEGWCVGFRALEERVLQQRWQEAQHAREASPESYQGRLGHVNLSHVQFINSALRQYDEITDQLDIMIHLDAQDPLFVYAWRLEQEESLRERTGSGMTYTEVQSFVDGYYPSYELYTQDLRRGRWPGSGRQLRIVLDENRVVQEKEIL